MYPQRPLSTPHPGLVAWPTWQSMEDGEPRRPAEQELLHEGTPQEHKRIDLAVRLPWHLHSQVRVVIRASQITGDVTMALERISD